MFRQLATLLQAGLTLAHSLQMLADQHPSEPWRALLQSVADELSEGCPFSEALRRWPAVFTPLHISMVKTGELTGKLEECCRQLAQQQKAQQQLGQKVKKALRYPAIILTLAVLVVLAMVTLVLPEFAAIYKTFNTPLPALTRIVMGISAFMQSYALALFAVLLVPLTAAWTLRHTPRWQRFLLHLPVMGALAKGQKLGQIFTVLSLTQQAGIAFLQGLESAEETSKAATGKGSFAEYAKILKKDFPSGHPFRKRQSLPRSVFSFYERAKCQVHWTSCWQTWLVITRSKLFSWPTIWQHSWSRYYWLSRGSSSAR